MSDRGDDSFDDSEVVYLQKRSEIAVSENSGHLRIVNETIILAISPHFQMQTGLDC